MEFTEKEKSLIEEAVTNFRNELLQEQTHFELTKVSAIKSHQMALIEDMLAVCDRILQKLDGKDHEVL